MLSLDINSRVENATTGPVIAVQKALKINMSSATMQNPLARKELQDLRGDNNRQKSDRFWAGSGAENRSSTLSACFTAGKYLFEYSEAAWHIVACFSCLRRKSQDRE